MAVDFGEQVDLLEFIYLEDQALLFLAGEIQKESSVEYLLSCLIMSLMVRFMRHKFL